jgi:hypothetical protein
MGIKSFFKWSRDNQANFAAAISKELANKAEKDSPELQDVKNKVSKSGDTITGKLRLKGQHRTNPPLAIVSDNDSEIIIFPQNNTESLLVEKLSGGTFGFGWSGIWTAAFYALNFGNAATSLGTKLYKWGIAYIAKLNNGADIEIPNKAGTLALLSDIEDKILNGGTITGELEIALPPAAPTGDVFPIMLKGKFYDTSQDYIWKLGFSTVSTQFYIRYQNQNVIAVSPSNGIYPVSASFKLSLGMNVAPWEKTFTKIINAGRESEDIIVPSKGGTLALVSDIEDILKQHGLIQ